MGFRLFVRVKGDPALEYYGTKLYGYVNDETKLESWKYLHAHDKLKELGCDCADEEIYWGGEFAGEISLSATKFDGFAYCYSRDLARKYGLEAAFEFDYDILELLHDDREKLVSWR